jgi:carboxyl-terminal processing protease
MPKISKILLLAVSVVLVVTVFLGVNSTGVRAASGPEDGAYSERNVYDKVK